MSVVSSAFRPVKLTGAEAKKFKNQVSFGRPSQAARDSYARGKDAAREFAEKGFARLKRG